MTRTAASHLEITTPEGVFVVENAGHTLVEVPTRDYDALLGKVIYVAGNAMIDRNAARPVRGVGKVSRTEKINRPA